MKKDNKKNKKPLYALLLVAIIGIIGGTIAYFSNVAQFPNVLNTKKVPTVTTEEHFTPPDNWPDQPYVDKYVVTTNDADFDIAVRVKLEESWVPYNLIDDDDTTTCSNTTVPLKFTNSSTNLEESAALVHFNNTPSTAVDTNYWIDNTANDGWYYYKTKVAPNTSTVSLIKAVEYNTNTPAVTTETTTYSYCFVDTTEAADSAGKRTCKTTAVTTKPSDSEIATQKAATPSLSLQTTTTKVIGSTGCGYDGARYTLLVTVESVEYDQRTAAWGTSIPSIS